MFPGRQRRKLDGARSLACCGALALPPRRRVLAVRACYGAHGNVAAQSSTLEGTGSGFRRGRLWVAAQCRSLGHQQRFERSPATSAMPSISDVLLSRSKRRSGPIADVSLQGITSVRKIAQELNNRGILTPRGGEWQATTVVRLLARLRVQAG